MILALDKPERIVIIQTSLCYKLDRRKKMINSQKEIERRTKQYFYNDGLTEIAVGIVLLMLGVYFFGSVALPANSLVRTWLDAAFILVIFAGIFIVRRLVRFLKFRITYPRTGYVSYKKKSGGRRRGAVAGVSGGIVAAALSVLLAVSPSMKAWMPALNGFGLSLAVFLLARRTEIARYYVLAAASAVIGLAVALKGIGDLEGVSLYYAVFGAAVITSGLVALILYLRSTKTENGESDGR
jgi:hypothetical protein